MNLLKELDEDKGQFARTDIAIAALRDEIAAANFSATRGQDRLMSLVVAKLDEAQGLAILAYKQRLRIVLVDRTEILKTDETVSTVANGNGETNV